MRIKKSMLDRFRIDKLDKGVLVTIKAKVYTGTTDFSLAFIRKTFRLVCDNVDEAEYILSTILHNEDGYEVKRD